MAKSKRLTNALRDDIVTAVLNKTFDKRIEEQGKRVSGIYQTLASHLIPDDFKKVLQSGAVKPNWFGCIYEVIVHEESYRVNGNPGHVAFSGDAISVPCNMISRYTEYLSVLHKNLPEDLQTLVSEWVYERDAIEYGKKQLKTATMEILNSVSTVKQLKELWPEVETFYKLEENVMYPPMCVNTAGLNDVINQFKDA